MTAQGRTPLLRICLTTLALSSCAGTRSAPVYTPSFSETLQQETAQQKADDCEQLKPVILPANIKSVLMKIEAQIPADGPEREAAIKALTPEQRALLDWFNHDVAEGQNYQTYCSKET